MGDMATAAGFGRRRRISMEEDDGDDVEGQALLSERRQEPLGDAMEQMLTKKGVKSLVTAIKKGASINSPFTDGRGFDRLALHCAIERTLRTDIAEEWVHGVAVIQELLNRGANPNKLDGNSRTALTALKSLLLGPKDAHNGKEDIVRQIATMLIKAGGT
eukprot:m.177998 g.177998  ORF g.177998 m.177998 type:complete len:160 (+) comp14457_c0_seq1:234-713(+)